ncbi:tocopherol cyclase family protein [Clostridium swellfunianum]|uniref:tocopherol cyclase family protein n=1 Tax=Clostridium swellfunianum TaxID=1367462 RepID=UPI00202E8721|nr:tocopherol cyclase family protein [Clostridium swellfunianum]MCM0647370.1 tocopherol cyclase family protein [Clostridium swellfunianum]
MLKFIRNPDVYHGKDKNTNFFEGWYFKIVDPNKEYTYCFIPGIFLSEKQENSHSFIQVVKGHEADFKYLSFKKEQFEAKSNEFNIKVNGSTFSLKEINLNLKEQGEKIYGRLVFKNIIKWPDSAINPGSMGFYNYLDFMQCYSQVCAVDGHIEGKLNINGNDVDFTDGKVYIEKNWGKAFPYSYIWVQGNSFEKEETALTCSIGHIPFPIKSFTGFLIGIHAKGRFYKFTTINRSSLAINCEKEKIILETENKDYGLRIEAVYKEEDFIDLLAPRDDNMVPIARETLQGKLTVILYDKKSSSVILSDECSAAGIEFSGDYKSLYKKKETK